ncbi:hypothetical protein GCM10022410_07910 [Amphibacillus indicireducens]|uniref:Uncharacterized protein n=1 Tax=Amphibacillus indicireducens TaxID=1076330 RepID=A0ABP7VBJ2_9BACI
MVFPVRKTIKFNISRETSQTIYVYMNTKVEITKYLHKFSGYDILLNVYAIACLLVAQPNVNCNF